MKYKILAIVADWRGANDASFANAFKHLGNDVKIINVKKYFDNIVFIDKAIKKITHEPPAWIQNKFNKDIIKAVDKLKPDVVFIAKGLWVRLDTINYIKALGIRTVHWHPDDAFNPENTSKYLDECNPNYDLIVTPKTFNIKEYKRIGAKNVLYVQYCYDTEIHYPVKLDNDDKNKYGSEVVFVGAMRKKRVDELEYIYKEKFNLKIWGTGWRRLSNKYNIRKVCTMKPVYAEEMSKVFQTSKISLGFLNAENRDLHTARTFEIPACKGFLLAERTDEHRDIFIEGYEAEFFSDLDELCEKSKFYLKNENLREKIALSGYEKVIKMNATYEERGKKILNEIMSL